MVEEVCTAVLNYFSTNLNRKKEEVFRKKALHLYNLVRSAWFDS